MVKVKNKKAFFTTKWITYTAVLTALVVATTVIPPIPIGTNNVYWCDGAIFLGAYLMDPIASFIIGGLGSALYDFGLGKMYIAVPSLIIHGLQGAAVSALLHYAFKLLPKKHEAAWAGISSVLGAIIVIGGYLLYYWLVAPMVTGDSRYGWLYASDRILRNVIQEIIGISIAMVICYATTFKKQLEKQHLLPDFKGEILDKSEKVDTPKEDNGEIEHPE